MSLIAAIAPVVGNVVKDVVARVLPDKTEQQTVQQEILLALLAHEQQLTSAAASVVVAEARGESWLQRSWRPLTMLTFVGLIVVHWFGLTPHIDDAQVLAVFDIVQLGLGGYVVGRSAEKVMRTWREK